MPIPRLLAAALWAASAFSLPAASRPNVIVILTDDLGFSDLGCYGGEISTPTLDSLGQSGVRFRQYYVTPRCSPTRASLMTGIYHQRVADDPNNALPALKNDNNATLAELLRANGYRTYHAGKWHLGTGALTAENRGFQHTWRFSDGMAHSANQWNQSLYRLFSKNNEIPARTYSGANAFYQTDAIGDYSADFVAHNAAKGDGKPFFLYMAFGAPHFPLAAPKDLVDQYVPTFSKGWDVIARERYERQLTKGVIDARIAPPTRGPTAPHNQEPIENIPAWDSLPADRRADLARREAIFAAMVHKVDENVGKVVARLKATGQFDNTLIVFSSDNGGCHEFGKFGTWNGSSHDAPWSAAALPSMGLGGENIKYGAGWARVSNVPFRLFKHSTHEGGVRSPLIVNWPDGLPGHDVWEDYPVSVIDIAPTVLAAAGVPYPATFNGRRLLPQDGIDLLPLLRGTAEPVVDRALFCEHENNRMIRRGPWKFVTKNFTAPDGTLAHTRELYHVALDPAETQNVAAENPARVAEFVSLWNDWVRSVGLNSARLLSPPPVSVTPAPTNADLFVDTFNRANATDIDADLSGAWGSRVPPITARAAWFEGFEGSGAVDSISLADGVLQKVGVGMIENGLSHNFIGADIAAAGGFSVSLRVVSIVTESSDPANRYVGFGVGLNATQAATGNDINTNVPSPRPIRGSTTNPGAADCFVELDLNQNVKVWIQGALRATVPVGATSGTLTAAFACTGFGVNDPVTVSVYFDGRRLDLDPPAGNDGRPGDTLSFKWNEANANYLAISGRASTTFQVDNFAVRRLPLSSALAMEYGLSHGLDGDDAALTANPDQDQRDNYSEWALGTDPTVPDDANGAPTVTSPSLAEGFRFSHRRLRDHAGSGVSYRYAISEDLKSWQPTDPSTLSALALVDRAGYEAVELRLPDSDLLGRDRVFLRVETATP